MKTKTKITIGLILTFLISFSIRELSAQENQLDAFARNAANETNVYFGLERTNWYESTDIPLIHLEGILAIGKPRYVKNKRVYKLEDKPSYKLLEFDVCMFGSTLTVYTYNYKEFQDLMVSWHLACGYPVDNLEGIVKDYILMGK